MRGRGRGDGVDVFRERWVEEGEKAREAEGGFVGLCEDEGDGDRALG